MMAVRAIRGDFSPPEGAEDNEYVEDALTSALISFPATVKLKIISVPMEKPDEADLLSADLNLLCYSLEGAGAPDVCVVERGSRRSFELSLDVPDAASLAILRRALLEDERVQMVF